MKRLSRVVVALLLAITMAALLPIQVLADAQVEYISEVKVFTGSYSEAEKEGYKILTDGKNPVDLNQKAGGGSGSKGDKAVYLGYKTTEEASEAITDLALMNMNGGYSVQDYESLMETQMKAQIIPFVENFQIAIDEYRENYNSDNAKNKQRAQYIHDALNKFTDDDCDGAGLGDLLLNETKYEMGDAAYDKLSEDEKKQHADILTILAQSNGKATLMMENLLTRAADTNDDSWLERFVDLTYDDLIDETGLAPSKAKKELTKKYDDDAHKILEMWDNLRESLLDYDNAVARLESAKAQAFEDSVSNLNDINDKSSDKEIIGALTTVHEQSDNAIDILNDTETVAIYEALNNIDYDGGTMVDFFIQEKEAVEEDITRLYPLVAAFSDGQRAGFDFVSLFQLCAIGLTDEKGYKSADIETLKALSIYDGIDRDIYQKGGVALTSDSLRTNAAEAAVEDDTMLSKWTVAGYVIAGASAVALVGSAAFAIWASTSKHVKNINTIATGYKQLSLGGFTGVYDFGGGKFIKYKGKKITVEEGNKIFGFKKAFYDYTTPISKYMAIGFSVVMVAASIYSLVSTIQDMKAYYQTDFTPIPHYIVDEKDLVAYNVKGEKEILKNQSAYYKAAETNRAEGDEFFDILGTSNDLNGTVGKQWLTLYAVKNEVEDPILASSLKAVVGNADLPAGYETGIHTFGSDAAFNLNNSQYVWNNSAPETYVYFKRDAGKASKNTGSNFTAGSIAISGGAGIAIGALAAALGIKGSRKKKENDTVTA